MKVDGVLPSVCWYKALKLTHTRLTSGPKTLGWQDMKFVSEKAQTTEQNHKAKKGLISSLLLPLVMLWKMETLPTQQCQEGSTTEMGTPQWNEGFRVSEAESPLTTPPQTSPTTATPQTLPWTLRDVRRAYSWTKPTKNEQKNWKYFTYCEHKPGRRLEDQALQSHHEKGKSPKRKGSHTKWKHRQAQTSVAKHIKAEKLQAKPQFLFGFWQEQELPWEKLERMQVYRAWHLCDQRERGCRHRSSTKKARAEQGKGAPMPYLSPAPKGCPPSARSCSSVLLFTRDQWAKHHNYLVQFFSQPKSQVKKAGTELHFWEHNWFLSSSASLVVSVSQIFHLSLAKQQVPEKALRVRWHPKRHFQTNIMSSYTNIILSHLC